VVTAIEWGISSCIAPDQLLAEQLGCEDRLGLSLTTRRGSNAALRHPGLELGREHVRALARERRDRHECIRRAELARGDRQVLGDLLRAGAVGLVDHEHRGRAHLLDQPRDEAVAAPDRLGCVDEEADHIHLAQRRQGSVVRALAQQVLGL